MVEQDLVRMRRKIAEQQKELQEKEQELKKRKSEDSGEWRNVQSEAEEGACGKYMHVHVVQSHSDVREGVCRNGKQ